MIEQRLVKVTDEGDPRRCQGVVKNGQCPFIAIEGTPYCKMHQGGTKAACDFDGTLRNYRLAKWQARTNEFADSPQVKSLREEVGILRIVMEEILNKCQDSTDLLLYSSKIADHVLKIEKVVKSCHQLELSAGSLLDKTVVIQIADSIVKVIGDYITDAVTLDKIGTEIVIAIMSVNNLKV